MFPSTDHASPAKKQRTLEALAFKPMTPEDKVNKMQVEDEKHKKNKEDAAQQILVVDKKACGVAAIWGLPWPKSSKQGPNRKGGPVPRDEKWENGLYEWIGKISRGEVAAPTTTPPRQFPLDWDHKSTPVWQYVHKTSQDKNNEGSPQGGNEGVKPAAQVVDHGMVNEALVILPSFRVVCLGSHLYHFKNSFIIDWKGPVAHRTAILLSQNTDYAHSANKRCATVQHGVIVLMSQPSFHSISGIHSPPAQLTQETWSLALLLQRLRAMRLPPASCRLRSQDLHRGLWDDQ